MGNKQSTMSRQVQPSLPYSFQYNRLSSSSLHSDDNNNQQQPLLHNHTSHDEECMEQLKSDIEANRKKNESLEKRNAALERQVCELRDTIYKQQSRVPPIVETNVAALKNQIHELKSAVSRLESSSHQLTPVGTSTGMGSNAVLKKEVDRLEHRVMQLELDTFLIRKRNFIDGKEHTKYETTSIKEKEVQRASRNITSIPTTLAPRGEPDHILAQALDSDFLMGVRKQEMEKIVEKNAELEDRLAQLTTTIDELKSLSSHETGLTTPTEADHGIQGHERDDLASCLIVLIFLVSVLIGVNI